MSNILPALGKTIERIKTMFPEFNPSDFDTHIDAELIGVHNENSSSNNSSSNSVNNGISASENNVGRNDPCYCKSGKRFKHCHGSLA